MKRDGSKVFHVSVSEAGATLFDALRRWHPDRTGVDTRQLVSQRRVQIDGNLCLDTRRRLKEREVVKVLPHPVTAPPSENDIRVSFVDEHVVVVEKPAGMTTMRHAEETHWSARRRQRQATVDELLPGLLANRRRSRPSQPRGRTTKRGPTPKPALDERRVRVIPVHRLDRET